MHSDECIICLSTSSEVDDLFKCTCLKCTSIFYLCMECITTNKIQCPICYRFFDNLIKH